MKPTLGYLPLFVSESGKLKPLFYGNISALPTNDKLFENTSEQATSKVKMGLVSFEREEYSKAIQLFDQALTDSFDSPIAWLGKTYCEAHMVPDNILYTEILQNLRRMEKVIGNEELFNRCMAEILSVVVSNLTASIFFCYEQYKKLAQQAGEDALKAIGAAVGGFAGAGFAGSSKKKDRVLGYGIMAAGSIGYAGKKMASEDKSDLSYRYFITAVLMICNSIDAIGDFKVLLKKDPNSKYEAVIDTWKKTVDVIIEEIRKKGRMNLFSIYLKTFFLPRSIKYSLEKKSNNLYLESSEILCDTIQNNRHDILNEYSTLSKECKEYFATKEVVVLSVIQVLMYISPFFLMNVIDKIDSGFAVLAFFAPVLLSFIIVKGPKQIRLLKRMREVMAIGKRKPEGSDKLSILLA